MIEKKTRLYVQLKWENINRTLSQYLFFCCNTATKIKKREGYVWFQCLFIKIIFRFSIESLIFFNLYVYLSKVSLCIYCGTHLFKQFLFLIHSFFLFSYKHCLPNCLYDDDDDDDGYQQQHQQHRHHFERFINIMENSDNSVFLFWFWFVSVFFSIV